MRQILHAENEVSHCLGRKRAYLFKTRALAANWVVLELGSFLFLLSTPSNHANTCN